ncbi:MAG: 4-alpha-glucanotransferase [Labilithrix sp.]|nr:4-alpha-glucanotransferase [Labilithrix sp.]
MGARVSSRNLVQDALRALGIEQLVLSIHDASFPSAEGEDTGRGSPYARGGAALLELAGEMGFDGILLGPQGETSIGNPSPYDGSVFSKSVLSVALAELGDARFAGLLSRDDLAAIVARSPGAPDYAHAFKVQHEGVATAAQKLRKRLRAGDPAVTPIAEELAAFERDAAWLVHDARFETFLAEHGHDDWRRWPEADRAPSDARIAEVEHRFRDVRHAYVFGQWVLHVQHAALRDRTRALGLRLYGDLQVGLSLRDRWARGALFLPGYLMGAPPSRTNPEGQPWGYPVLDPRKRAATEAFVRARVTKLFAELDALRVDHPHGLVCPWVYQAETGDDLRAVQRGARLFESPNEDGHPALAGLAIARPDQIDRAAAPYDDARVRDLDEAQVDAYARTLDIVTDAATTSGRAASDVVCEVLSTCPEPLRRVLGRRGLGRFRVTQKAKMDDPRDVYRSENAEPRDWIMIGNHDTEPLSRVLERWEREGAIGARAAYLAARLSPDPSGREALARDLADDARKLRRAMFADLFVGPAAHVLVFFADLFGEREIYNRPGVVDDANWRLRLPAGFRALYEERRARGEALDLPAALAMAMRARGEAFARAHAALIDALEGA